MSENDFEKKVQDKMQGFDLNPAADLWKKVEHRIRKEKKRRFIFWWPLGLVLLAGGIGIPVWLSRDNKKETPVIVSENKSIQPTIKKESTQPEKNQNLITSPTPVAKSLQPGKTGIKPIYYFPVKKEKAGRVLVKKTNLETKDRTVQNTKIVQPLTTTDVSKTEKPPVVAVTSPGKMKTDSVDLRLPAAESPTSTETQPEKKKKKTETLTKWGLGISAGRSAIVNGIGNFDDRAYASTSSAPPTPAQLSNDRNTGTKGYFSLSAELFLKRPLSPKLEIVGALGYQFLSNRIQTGEKVDSNRTINNGYSQNLVVDGFYRPSNASNTTYYTNQFHFTTISAELSWRFTGKKTNFRWNNGVSYNWLVASSMLHYDQALQGFYKDIKRLTRNHLFINTALSLPVSKRLTLNPFASYSLTPVMRRAVSDSANTRFSNFGLRLRFLIDRKK